MRNIVLNSSKSVFDVHVQALTAVVPVCARHHLSQRLLGPRRLVHLRTNGCLILHRRWVPQDLRYEAQKTHDPPECELPLRPTTASSSLHQKPENGTYRCNPYSSCVHERLHERQSTWPFLKEMSPAELEVIPTLPSSRRSVQVHNLSCNCFY